MSCKGCGKQIRNIIVGWTSLLVRKPDKLAKIRLRICRNCEYNRWKGLRMWCAKCKCHIPAKVRVPEEHCPLDKW